MGEQPSECADDRDNDDDGDKDCGDLDCQALSVCGGIGRSRDPVGMRQIGDAYVGQPHDAGRSEPPAVPTDSGKTDPPDRVEHPEVHDAGMPADAAAGCPDGCADNEHCAVDRCIEDPAVMIELWDVARVEALVPRAIGARLSACLDASGCIWNPRPPFTWCGCAADPQVQFWVDVDPGDDTSSVLAGETTVLDDSDEASWSSPGITLAVLPTSNIYMKMVDHDLASEEPIFGCNIPGSAVLEGGPIECTDSFPVEDPDAVEFYIRTEVTPHVETAD